MPTRAHWFGLAAALMLAGVPSHAAETSITAIVGATVIHPDRDLPSAVAPDSTLIIAGRRIESIGPAGSTALPAGAARKHGKRKRGGPRPIDLPRHFFQSGQLFNPPPRAPLHAWGPFSEADRAHKG